MAVRSKLMLSCYMKQTVAEYHTSLTFMGWMSQEYKLYNGPVIVSYTQRRKITVVYSLIIHDCTTLTSCENVLNENTARTEGIQITFFIMSSISLVTHLKKN